MHRSRLLPALALLLLSASGAAAEETTGHRSSLFNGKDLNGWHVTDCKVDVEDGLLVLKEGNGLVRSDHRYSDFILEVEWRALSDKDWDSGVYIRAELPPKGRPWPTRYQANLRQGMEGNISNLKGAESSGLIKPGEWNHFKFTVVGDRVELEINGKHAWKAAGLEPRDGYIGLQAEVPSGGQFQFRNIHLTELGFRSLFNGRDLSGWEGAGKPASLCWAVEDAALLCTGKSGPWLRSAAQYGDFNLRLEYKLAPGGNSGVYVRVPSDGRHHGAGAGVEIQILDDQADRYKNLKPYQYTGSVYAIAPATQHVGREAGQWNSLEINCEGTSYRVTHNGIVIVDATEKDFPQLKERLAEGFLGLQNHTDKVWYRNLRIGPAQ